MMPDASEVDPIHPQLSNAKHGRRDRLATARLALAIAAAVTIFAAGATGLLLLRGTPAAVTSAAQLTHQFRLSTLSLLPSGRRVRLGPEAETTVDLRFSPQLPATDLASETLLLPRLQTP
ncbi:MAG TPA: hypothetical protein ACFCUC_01005 [Desulfobacterales bacterium]